MIPAIIIAAALNTNKNFLYMYYIHYFLLKYFIKNGAAKAPKAAPTGIAPINPPITLLLPADQPKYYIIIVDSTLDRNVKQKPK